MNRPKSSKPRMSDSFLSYAHRYVWPKSRFLSEIECQKQSAEGRDPIALDRLVYQEQVGLPWFLVGKIEEAATSSACPADLQKHLWQYTLKHLYPEEKELYKNAIALISASFEREKM
ncbi:hypothetical protein Bealeia1_01965 (plasmid) [Candidatus Bealeia paramacronuclearis]|uniref:Uncharacterized protein n=1 Tax=Candidatus Bealeia paramacronuclearis TaxID=1921001 RepID=A0ABZ2C5K8_9PROT|nr:hypothetical protein [Candidatus Bealeia paramacronuclearis]